MAYHTHVGSLDSYEKGTIKVNDDLRHYAFSNIFEVANNSQPFERVAVVKNIEYVAEVMKVEGESGWYAAPHDEFAIVMDGEIEFIFKKLDDNEIPDHEGGAVQLEGEPGGQRMGRIVARRGHEVLLPRGAAYQVKATRSSVTIIQTVCGPVTVERWSQICTLT